MTRRRLAATYRCASLLSIVVAILVAVAARAENAGAVRPAVPDLFSSDEPLSLQLSFDRRRLCRPHPRKTCAASPATLGYVSSDGVIEHFEMRVKARGSWRNDHCDVPPLFLDVAGAATGGSPFASHRVLVLTTHCRNASPRYEQYMLKEYLAYRLYGLFSDKSLRVRLARIRYGDVGRRGRTVERFGFFVEHFDAFAERHGAELRRRAPSGSPTRTRTSSRRSRCFST